MTSPADLEYLRAMLASATRTTPHALPDPSPTLVAAGLVVQGVRGWNVTAAGVEAHMLALRARRREARAGRVEWNPDK